VHDPQAYAERLEGGSDPAVRGLALSRDDAIRQYALLRLYCDARIDAGLVSEECGIDFAEYFRNELERLAAPGGLERDGLVHLQTDGSVELTFPLGRVLMRNVAAVFDAYLDREAFRFGQPQVFSASA
jgi:oxygen-independent coproporphyrinogen III oxidase